MLTYVWQRLKITAGVTSCPQPAPSADATCQVDENREPVWAINGNFELSSGSHTDGLVVYGNLTISGDLTTTDRVIVVYGCPIIQGTAPDPNSTLNSF